MYKWSMSCVLKKTASLSCQASTKANKFVGRFCMDVRWGALLLIPLLLTGCNNKPNSSRFPQAVQTAIPETKIVDYRPLSCNILWDLDDKETLENALYWLRAMDCAESLSSTQARALTKKLPVVAWSSAFKQGILISSADPSISERRQVVERLNSYSQNFPEAVRALIQLWREQQVLRISLAEERVHYQRLQSESDTQIDRLRENQVRLQYNLSDITRKLENLTDIERQLSSRKQLQNEIPETGVDRKAAVPKAAEVKPQPAKPVEAQPKAAKPAEAEPVTPQPAENKSLESKPPEVKPAEINPETVVPRNLAVPQPVATPAGTDTPPADVPPASNKGSHDTTQTGQSTAG